MTILLVGKIRINRMCDTNSPRNATVDACLHLTHRDGVWHWTLTVNETDIVVSGSPSIGAAAAIEYATRAARMLGLVLPMPPSGTKPIGLPLKENGSFWGVARRAPARHRRTFLCERLVYRSRSVAQT